MFVIYRQFTILLSLSKVNFDIKGFQNFPWAITIIINREGDAPLSNNKSNNNTMWYLWCTESYFLQVQNEHPFA